MFSIWDLLVEQIAGSFAISLILIVMVMGIVLAFGSVSFFSSLLFSIVFVFAMTLGYGYSGLTTIIAAGAMAYFISQIVLLIDRWGG